MSHIFSYKLLSARILNAFSQQKLADKADVSKQMISKYEKGLSMPSSEVLIKLAKALQVQVDYFFTPQTIELGALNFRKKSKLSITRLKAIKEEVKNRVSNYIEIENILQIETAFKTSVQKRKISSLEDIEKSVLAIRNEWKIGIDPVHNIIQALEDQEIKVIEIEEEENLFDGMATLIDDKYAVIVVNKNFGIERKRFTLLHELGHLLLDLPNCDKKEEEKFCNRFAGEFLFPKSSIIREFGIKRDHISLKELIEMQKKYGISISAIVYRLKDIGIISEAKQRNFHISLNANPELKELVYKERFNTPEFSNRYEQLVYRAFSQELISASKAASLLDNNINKVLEKVMM